MNTPKWGSVVEIGKHKGEKLQSYEQAWDIFWEVLKDTDCMKGITYK